MRLATIINMTVLICVPVWGNWAAYLAWALWWVVSRYDKARTKTEQQDFVIARGEDYCSCLGTKGQQGWPQYIVKADSVL